MHGIHHKTDLGDKYQIKPPTRVTNYISLRARIQITNIIISCYFGIQWRARLDNSVGRIWSAGPQLIITDLYY